MCSRFTITEAQAPTATHTPTRQPTATPTPTTRPATATLTPTPPSPCPSVISGWKGEYWANENLSGTPALCRDDPAVDFDWRDNAPASALPADHFSVRWSRSLSLAGATTASSSSTTTAHVSMWMGYCSWITGAAIAG